MWKWKCQCAIMSDSFRPYRLQSARLLCPWDFLGNSTGVDCHFLLQGIFPTQRSNPGLPHRRQTLYRLSHQRSHDQLKQNIKKQRHCFANKGPSSQGYGFPLVMYGWESWTIKKDEHQRIDTFELWCWRRLLRVLWPVWRFNQSILKEISPEYSLERLMLKLKLQYIGHLKNCLIWKDPDVGKD